MTPTSQPLTTALVLETNNLRGGSASDEATIVASLERLLRHLTNQTRPLAALDEAVVTHDGLSEPHRRRIETAAGVAIRFVELPPATGYYEAKNLGFDATRASVVVFGDADCWPEPAWLASLLAPFSDDKCQVVAGRTTYRDDLFGAAASAIDFMYFRGRFGADCTRNFYANNVAFRREVFAARRYRPAEGIYRGHCQKLGLQLASDGVPVRFVPAARTIHRFPDSIAEFLRLRLLRGADTVEMAPHIIASAAPGLGWLGRLPTLSALAVLGVRFGFSLRAVGHQDLAELSGVQRAACFSLVAAISGADLAGALARSVFRLDLGVRDGSLTRDALSYHGDGDRLAA